MCEKLENLTKCLDSLILPASSTTWAVCPGPKCEFLAVVNLTKVYNRIVIDKQIMLAPQEADDTLKVTVLFNDELVQLPEPFSKINEISDLNSLIYVLHELKFCSNAYNYDSFPKCTKYTLHSSNAVFCDSCALHILESTPQQAPAQFVLDEPVAEDNGQIGVEEKSTENKKLLCTVCGKLCQSGMADHMLTHSKEKPFKCEVCGKGFAKKHNLTVHCRTHSGERPYICSKCGKTYSSASNLSTHLNSVHTEQKRHRCGKCNATFVHPRMLRLHERTHTGERPYTCALCNKSFTKNVHLTIHTRTHTGEKPYKCDRCDKAFTTSGNLNNHKKTHVGGDSQSVKQKTI